VPFFIDGEAGGEGVFGKAPAVMYHVFSEGKAPYL
jgi:hypothetical protein